jgi:hypothetical protein
MRNLTTLLSNRPSTGQRSETDRRREAEKQASGSKAKPKKRCLNEAAHKLDR